MSTYFPKPTDIKHNWHLVDLKGQVLGRVASRIANVLRGKNKPDFTPNADCGDFVVAINAAEIMIKGKPELKTFTSHTQYPGGLKVKKLPEVMAKDPAKAFQMTIKGMLPKTHQGRDMLKRLKVFSGSEHDHEAQKPTPLTLT